MLEILAFALFGLGGSVSGQVLAQVSEGKPLVPGLLIIAACIAIATGAAIFLDARITGLDMIGWVVAFVFGGVVGWKTKMG